MTEVAVYQQPAALAVPDRHDTDSWIEVVQDILKIANVIYDTPFVPDGLRGSAPAVAAAMLAGREMGLGIMTSLANIDVIKGRPAQKALLMRAMILSQGHQWQDGDVSDVRAVVRGRRKGEAEWAEVTFTAAQAKQAGIDLGKYPADKLYARATSRLARRKFADVIMGMPYSSEEREDGYDEGDEPPAEAQANGTAPAAPAPAPRTAQRRRPATTVPPPAEKPSTPVAKREDPADGLPPLPGEDEPVDASQPLDEGVHPFDRDKHGTSTRGKGGQLTALWTVLNTVYLFTDKDEARKVVEKLISRQLDGGTTGDLSFNEAKGVLNSLDLIRVHAEKEKITPREELIVFLTKIDEAVGGGDGA